MLYSPLVLLLTSLAPAPYPHSILLPFLLLINSLPSPLYYPSYYSLPQGADPHSLPLREGSQVEFI